MNIDQRINEVLDKFCKNDGQLKVDSDFRKYYKENTGVFDQMINESKLITKNIQGKIYLTQKGIIVCKLGGWVKYLKRKKSQKNINRFKKYKIKNIKSWIIGSIIFLAAATTLLLNAMDIIQIFPQKNNSINQNQFEVPKEKNQQQKDMLELYDDSLNIQKTDSLN